MLCAHDPLKKMEMSTIWYCKDSRHSGLTSVRAEDSHGPRDATSLRTEAREFRQFRGSAPPIGRCGRPARDGRPGEPASAARSRDQAGKQGFHAAVRCSQLLEAKVHAVLKRGEAGFQA